MIIPHPMSLYPQMPQPAPPPAETGFESYGKWLLPIAAGLLLLILLRRR